MNQHDPNQIPPHLREDHVISNSPFNPDHPSSAAHVKPKPHKLRTFFIVAGSILAGFLVLGILIAGVSTSSDAPVGVTAGSPVAPATTAPVSEPTEDTADPTPAPTQAKSTKAAPKLTAGQEQAIGSAQSYLSMTAFSRKGLIQQLSSDAGDGYSVADATFAVDYLKVNWNDQAAKAAKNYLSMTHFSRSGLIRQLESSAGDGFTHSQAVYGVKKAGL